jgi:hypothetical protein
MDAGPSSEGLDGGASNASNGVLQAKLARRKLQVCARVCVPLSAACGEKPSCSSSSKTARLFANPDLTRPAPCACVALAA